MKKDYTNAKVEITYFDSEEIIVASGDIVLPIVPANEQ